MNRPSEERKALTRGEEKGGGKIREKKLNQEEIGGRKKSEDRPNHTRRGEASAGDWDYGHGRDKGLLPTKVSWARTLQRAIGGQGRKEQCSRGQMYLGGGARYGVR